MLKSTTLLAGVAAASFSFSAAPAKAQNFWLGQIVLGGWDFCPRTTAPADGSLLAISSNSALFALLGCNFGGDCRTTFALPDLRGRAAVSQGQQPGLSFIRLADKGGTETTTLNQLNMPVHTHTITSTASASVNVGNGPAGAYGNGEHIAAAAQIYAPNGTPSQPLDPNTVQVAVNSTALNNGGSQPFNNRDPFLGLQYCVVTQGIFPSRN